MFKRLLSLLAQFVMFAIVVAIAAYWGIKLLTPPPTSAPPPLTAAPPRDPDPVLAARMFGLVQRAQTAVVSNVQVAGVVAAGDASSAVLIVDGQPARAYLLGQEVTPGMTLKEVRPDGVTLASGRGQQELKVPERPVAAMGGAPPAPGFTRSGNTLSAPAAADKPVAPVRAPAPPPAQPPRAGPLAPAGAPSSQ
ncbi:MAG TPA: type II secretion system protein N [Burkholderiaceae bacterium]|nr:type II secretion system protein N [Burkholderiaceae bacterium]